MTYAPASPIRAGLMTPAHAQFVEAGVMFCGTAGGTSSALTASTGKNLTGLMVNQIVGLKTGASVNPGAATLNIDGLGAKPIQKNGAALAGGDLAASADLWFQYDGTSFRLLGGSGGAGWLSTTVAKSADFTVSTSYNANLIRCTSALTATLDTIANLAAGFACRIWGDGVTVVISGGASTVNGAGSITLLAGEFADVTKDQAGTNFVATKGGASTVGWAFDAAKKDSNVVLSAAATVATMPSAATVGSVFGAKTITGAKVFSAKLTTLGAGTAAIGFATPATAYNGVAFGAASTGFSYIINGNKGNAGATSAFGSSYTVGDEIQIAVDVPNGKGWFSKNGAWQGGGNPATGVSPAFTFTAGTAMVPAVYLDGTTGGCAWTVVSTPVTVPTGFTIL